LRMRLGLGWGWVHAKLLWGKLLGNANLKDQEGDKRITLKWTLRR
jgi:hypothetical protein